MKMYADPRTQRTNTRYPVTSIKECIFSTSKHSYASGFFVVCFFGWVVEFGIFFYNIGWLFESFKEQKSMDAENK